MENFSGRAGFLRRVLTLLNAIERGSLGRKCNGARCVIFKAESRSIPALTVTLDPAVGNRSYEESSRSQMQMVCRGMALVV